MTFDGLTPMGLRISLRSIYANANWKSGVLLYTMELRQKSNVFMIRMTSEVSYLYYLALPTEEVTGTISIESAKRIEQCKVKILPIKVIENQGGNCFVQ